MALCGPLRVSRGLGRPSDRFRAWSARVGHPEGLTGIVGRRLACPQWGRAAGAFPGRLAWAACLGGLPGRLARAACQGGLPGRLAWAACLGGLPGRLAWAACLGGLPGRLAWAACLGGLPGRLAWAACLVVGEPALSKNPLCIGRETTHPEKYKDLAMLAIRYDFSLPLPYIKGLFG